MSQNLMHKRKDSPTRGRHLVSTQKIQKGSLIFAERPLLSLQSFGNAHQGALCCRCCRAFIGGPQLALLIASGKLRREDAWEYYRDHEDELIRTCSDKDIGDINENYKMFQCRNGCGEIYCSQYCEEHSWKFCGHDLLCTGCIPEPESSSTREIEGGDQDKGLHPLLQFKVHAVQNNEIFIMVGDLIASVVSLRRQQIELQTTQETGAACNNESSQNQLDKIMAPYLDFTLVPWWDVATAPLISDPNNLEECAQLEKVMKEMCNESAKLLKDAMLLMLDSDDDLFRDTMSEALRDCDHLFSEDFFGKIIGSFEQNAIGIRARHPLCRDIFNLDLRTKRHKELIGCIEVAGMIGGDDDVEEIKGDENVEIKGGFEREAEECGEEQMMRKASDGGRWQEETLYTVDEISSFLADLYINESGNSSAEDENDNVDVGDTSNCDENLSTGDDLDNLFTPLDGTAMYHTTCKMNHSCQPNVLVRYNYSCSGGGLFARWGEKFPLVLQCIALRDIDKNEELCISYINSDSSYEQRKKQLANYGFECVCPKCIRDMTCSKMGSDDGLFEVDCVELFGENEDDLFGDGDSVNATEDGKNPTRAMGLLGVERSLNQSFAVSPLGKVPIATSASAHSFANQLGTQLLGDFQSSSAEVDKADATISLVTILRHALQGLRDRDTNVFLQAAIDGERLTMSILNKFKSWPTSAFRESHCFFSVLSAIGYADHGHVLPALEALDKAAVFGLSRELVGSLLQYLEFHSSVINSLHRTSCAIYKSQIPDYSRDEMRQIVLKDGLSKPIEYPIYEINKRCDDIPNKLRGGQALVIRSFASEWTAIEKWRNLDYLKEKFGNRLVPIEHGGMMDKSGMREELMTLRNFILFHLEPSSSIAVFSLGCNQTNAAYLAQHRLFDQISGLMNDIDGTPSMCGEFGPRHLNAWIGTGGTRTPLHFDSYDNLFVQIVGCKYVRLYDKSETEKLYVIRGGARYANQGNMSAVDCEKEDISRHPLALKAQFSEVVLYPGDALYIPAQTWHYVRSLSTSASVNYWW